LLCAWGRDLDSGILTLATKHFEQRVKNKYIQKLFSHETLQKIIFANKLIPYKTSTNNLLPPFANFIS